MSHGRVEHRRRFVPALRRGLLVVAPLLLTAVPGSAAVRSVQSATQSLSGSQTATVTIASVNPSRSFVICDARVPGDRPGLMPTCELTSSTTVLITYYDTASTINVRWQVVEFSNGVAVQRGLQTLADGVATANVSIGAVDTTRSFLLTTARANLIGAPWDGPGDELRTVRARLTSGTNLELSRNASSGAAVQVAWQVVQMDEATVQSNLTTIGAGSTSATATLPVAVNPNATFLVFSARAAAGAAGNDGDWMARGALTDATTLTFRRQGSATDLEISWFAVSMGDGTVVQKGSAAATNEAILDNPIGAVCTTSAAAFISSDAEVGNASLDMGTWTPELTSSTNLRLQRSFAAASPSNVDWFVVNFSGACANRRRVLVNKAKVGEPTTASLSNFPLLFSVTQAALRTTANGGQVSDPEGDDIYFRAFDSATCGGPSTCLLDHEVEKYVPTTGELVAWVRLPSVNGPAAATHTVIYVYWGDGCISTTLQNPNGVWDSGFMGVWHLKEDPGGGAPQMRDSTSNAFHGTASGGMSGGNQVPGMVGGSLDFDGGDDRLDLGPDLSILQNVGAATLSAWIRADTISTTEDTIVAISKNNAGVPTAASRASLNLTTSSQLLAGGRSADGDSFQYVTTTTNPVSTGTWYHVAAVIDYGADAVTIYVNGATQAATGTVNFSQSTTANTVSTSSAIASEDDGSDILFFDGLIDEVQVSGVARSAAWVLASYNNQQSPSTFAVPLGVESTCEFTCQKAITVLRGQVGDAGTTTLSSYPMLFSVVDPDLKTQANGGAVTSASGHDIVFRASDATTCGGPAACDLDFEIEKYVPTTGELMAWVRLPSVNGQAAGSDTVIQVHYGNPSVTSSRDNPAGVWDSNYVGVWHLEEDPSGAAPQMKDTTANTNHGTTAGSMLSTASESAKIGNGLRFDGVDDLVRMSDSPSLDSTNDEATLALWINWTNAADGGSQFVMSSSNRYVPPGNGYDWGSLPAGGHFFYPRGGVGDSFEDNYNLGPNPFTNGQWHHLVVTARFSTREVMIYVDTVAMSFTYQGVPVEWTQMAVLDDWLWGGNPDRPTRYFDGLFDEIHVSNVVRSAAWVATEYRNQNSPSTFYTIGGATCAATTAVTLQSFAAAPLDGAVSLSWETASELNNLGFHLYRGASADGPWTRLSTSLIPGLGSSAEGRQYTYLDAGLPNGTTYFYLLEDTETTGRTELHGPVSAAPGPASAPPGHEGEEGDDSSRTETRTLYGERGTPSLRVVEQGASHVVLELLTPGFEGVSRKGESGAFVVIPGFESASVPGAPAVPVRHALLEARVGRGVRITSVTPADVVRFSGLHLVAEGAPEMDVDEAGTVRARIAPRPLASSRERGGYFPGRWASLLGTLFQGETKKARLQLSPLRYDPLSATVVLARRLVVRLEFSGTEAKERPLRGSQGRRPGLLPPLPRRGVVAQLVTREPGLYRLRFEDAFASNPRGLAVQSLRLSRRNQAVSFHVEPARALFAPGSSLFFLAGSSIPGRDATHELEVGPEGPRMNVVDASPTGSFVGEALRTVTFERNRFYQSGLLEAPDLWLWDLLVSPVTKSYPFTLTGLASSSTPGRLTLVLQGASDFPADPDHHLRVLVNGTPVGETSWDGKKERVFEAELLPGVLGEGINTLSLQNVGDTGASSSLVFSNRFSIRYPSTLVAEGGRLEADFVASGEARVIGVGREAFALDRTAAPIWLKGLRHEDGELAFRAEPDHRYLVIAENGVLSPEVRRPSGRTLRSTANRTDWLLLAPRELLPAAKPLLDLRRQEGLAVRAVSLEDVYDTFGFGEKSPEAIKAFLEYAWHNWKKPSFRYVVLLGDSTYDPQDDLKTGVKDRLPFWPIKTSFLWTASDPAYAAVNGEDLVPDVALGRLPARNLEEAQALVAKVVAYEQTHQRLRGPAVLVADNADRGGSFEVEADEVAANLASSRDVQKVYLRDLGPSTRNEIRGAFDAGAGLLSYVGHGATAVWASENVFNNTDVATLSAQAQQPLLVTMNCLNGFFHIPSLDSLAEALLKAQGKGVIAAFSPSGLSLDLPAHVYHRALLAEVESGRHVRLGDAVLAAQSAYADSGSFPELLSIYHLFGDPAMRIR